MTNVSNQQLAENIEDAYIENTERLNQLTEYVCSVYGLTYNELADELGVNRGWFTRMRNGGFGEWRYNAVVGLVTMAAQVNARMLFGWVCGNSKDQPANGLVRAFLGDAKSR